MSVEQQLAQLLHQTQTETHHYFVRLQQLAALLSHIYRPLAFGESAQVEHQAVVYRMDDLLVLVFEFVQLTQLFSQFSYAAESLTTFLGHHGARVEQLHCDGRFDHLNDLVAFRLQHEQRNA